MTGSSLADWQTIYNTLNERIKAVQNTTYSKQQPVPQTKNHIRSLNDLTGLDGFDSSIPLTIYCDKDTPLSIITESSSLWPYAPDYKGNHILYANTYTSTLGSGADIHRIVPLYGSYPPHGGVIANSGWFLDWANSTFQLMYKSMAGTRTFTKYRAHMYWNQSDGEVYDYATGEIISGFSPSSFSEFYQYVKSHLTQYNGSTTCEGSTSIEYDGNNVYVDLIYSYYTIPLPGFVAANVKVYYSSEGVNLGWPVTNYTYTEDGETFHHVDYSTRDYTNVTPGNPITVGFTSSIFPETPTLPAVGSPYTQTEELKYVFAVCDFSSYFTYN